MPMLVCTLCHIVDDTGDTLVSVPVRYERDGRRLLEFVNMAAGNEGNHLAPRLLSVEVGAEVFCEVPPLPSREVGAAVWGQIRNLLAVAS